MRWGRGQRASIASLVTARRASRAAPKAAPVSPSAKRWIGMFRTLASTDSQKRERGPPAIGEREGDALQPGLHDLPAIGGVAQPVEHAAHVGIVMRRPLAGEVGQEA